ncbi:MAG: DNA polymerase III subunit alpha [Deltaproteobacteria bacterium]|nr:DNA polymerase III subunit alpha [Deltaproteobacteria bacterium]
MFVHLHLHTQYSMLDGAIRVADLVPKVAALGMPAVAMTDHGNLYGAIDLYQRAKAAGVKPIYGIETYVASKGRKDRSARDSYHLVLLAKDADGYKNLMHLSSMAFTEGFYYNPRIDKEILREHSKGLFALSACLGGEVAQAIERKDDDALVATIRDYKEIFGDSYFLEVQENGIAQQRIVNERLKVLGAEYGIPLVATNDCHYMERQDARAHDILMCIQTGKTIHDNDRLHHEVDEFYLKSPDEMRARFAWAPEAVENTLRIARECDVKFDLSKTHLPQYQVPAGDSVDSYLRRLADEGLRRRFDENGTLAEKREAYAARLAVEVDVIQKMGFSGYFLIVWDFINHAKSKGIPVGPGRGSGAGSLVAYALRITDIDPLPYGLIFERFLNPERISMPDFDVDFCMDRRDEVIKYVVEKYGRDRVGQIITFGQLKARSCIKDVGRALGLPYTETDRISKLIPQMPGKVITIKDAFEMEPRLKEVVKEKPEYQELVRVAEALEGLNRHAGVHAAGVVISERPLWEHVPVCKVQENEMVTQFAKDEVEKAGLVKFDFLGLKTLTVVDNAVRLVRGKREEKPQRHRAEEIGRADQGIDIARIALDDATVFKMLAAGDTDGVFQMESSGFTDMIKRLKPDRFEDLIAAVALYRPGPMESGMMDDYINRKHGRAKVVYPHVSCESVLAETYGVIVYQEQVMQIAVALSGYTMGQADTLRKIMGKKKPEEMAKERAHFVGGAVEKSGMAKEAAEHLFEQIEKFAGYAFNKSHSAAYALLAYQTAYLKRHHPAEFWAALLTAEKGNQDKIASAIHAARAHGLKVLPPDVNESGTDFTVVGDDTIRFGFAAVKNVGTTAIESILGAREKSFRDIYDFCERVDLRKVNRRVLESLVKSGAFDSRDPNRARVVANLDKATEAAQLVQRERESGQIGLFGAALSVSDNDVAPRMIDAAAWTEKETLANEKAALGLYVSGHPLARYAKEMKRIAGARTVDLVDREPESEVSVCGLLTDLRERPSKTGQGRNCFGVLEDLVGSVEVLIFSRVFERVELTVKADEPVMVTGKVLIEGDDESPVAKIRVDEVVPLLKAREARTKAVEIRLDGARTSLDSLSALRERLAAFQGTCRVFARVSDGDREAILEFGAKYRVRVEDAMVDAIEAEIGKGCVRLV